MLFHETVSQFSEIEFVAGIIKLESLSEPEEEPPPPQDEIKNIENKNIILFTFLILN